MPLPPSILSTETVTLGADRVAIRSLSRAQVYEWTRRLGRDEWLEPFVLACGTESTEEEAAAWLAENDPARAVSLLTAIFTLSGLNVRVREVDDDAAEDDAVEEADGTADPTQDEGSSSSSSEPS